MKVKVMRKIFSALFDRLANTLRQENLDIGYFFEFNFSVIDQSIMFPHLEKFSSHPC